MKKGSFEEEFSIVELILNSNSETKGVDAFALSLIKSERQIRKIFTYLIFQNTCFSKEDVKKLREILSSNHRVYFEHFIDMICEITGLKIEEIVGERHKLLLQELCLAKKYRDKIFHGQVTLEGLSQVELINKISSIKEWCKKLSDYFVDRYGYDGFARDSYQKNGDIKFSEKHFQHIKSLEDYKGFLKKHSKKNENKKNRKPSRVF